MIKRGSKRNTNWYILVRTHRKYYGIEKSNNQNKVKIESASANGVDEIHAFVRLLKNKGAIISANLGA